MMIASILTSTYSLSKSKSVLFLFLGANATCDSVRYRHRYQRGCCSRSRGFGRERKHRIETGRAHRQNGRIINWWAYRPESTRFACRCRPLFQGNKKIETQD